MEGVVYMSPIPSKNQMSEEDTGVQLMSLLRKVKANYEANSRKNTK